MTLILHIETSTKVCSVSLAENGKQIALKEESSDKYIHSEKLNLFIEEVFSQVKYKLQDLDAVCVSKGPGSYTGLRIGVSSAKGLCYALDIPLISIDSLTALVNDFLAKNTIKNDAFLMPMIDARRMEVYTATFDFSGKMITKIVAKVIDAGSFDKSSFVLIGDGAEKFQNIIPENVIIKNHLSSASGLVSLAYKKFTNNDFEDVAYFEPFYLKEFVGG